MRIFQDSSLKEEIINKSIDLGIVMAGDSKEYSFYLYNDEESLLEDLSFSFDSNEIKVLQAPKTLKSQEKGTLVIKYFPSVTTRMGLRAQLQVKGFAIWS